MVTIMGMITVLCRVLLNSLRTELFWSFFECSGPYLYRVPCIGFSQDNDHYNKSGGASEAWLDGCMFLRRQHGYGQAPNPFASTSFFEWPAIDSFATK
jgi:hypothetical protein